MDGLGFDELTKRVGTSLPRRRAFWFLGGVIGGLLPALPGASVDGKKKKKKKKKKKCPTGSAPCGNGCCPGDLLHYCCNNQSCCAFEQGCSKAGLCSDCKIPTENNGCIKYWCDDEGLQSEPEPLYKQPCFLDIEDPNSTTCFDGRPAMCDGGTSCGCMYF